MPSHPTEEITLIMCECCYEFTVEEEYFELNGMPYCFECIADLRYMERWIP
jgi:formylmethanofuran dehydrogenase subunit E